MHGLHTCTGGVASCPLLFSNPPDHVSDTFSITGDAGDAGESSQEGNVAAAAALQGQLCSRQSSKTVTVL